MYASKGKTEQQSDGLERQHHWCLSHTVNMSILRQSHDRSPILIQGQRAMGLKTVDTAATQTLTSRMTLRHFTAGSCVWLRLVQTVLVINGVTTSDWSTLHTH